MRLSTVSLFFAALLGLASALHAQEGGFIATLSTEEQEAAGLTSLSAEQQILLNTLVAREVSLARQGGVTTFAGTFTSRRKPEESARAGLDQLNTLQRAALDRLVAQAIAAKPVPLPTTRRMREEELKAKSRVETHGEVSFVYGFGSHGRDLVGGSVYTEVYDPDTGVSIGVGLSRYAGDGWWGWGPAGCWDFAPMTRWDVGPRTMPMRGGHRH